MRHVDSYVRRSNMKQIKGQFTSRTDLGKVRLVNEDRAISLVNAKGDVLLVVCDGLGGHNKGDYASDLAVKLLIEEFENKSLFFGPISIRLFFNHVLKRINHEIYETAEKNKIYADMGTTIVLALIHHNRVYIVYAGDSRAYALKDNVFIRLTQDHSYVDYLYNIGKINEEEKEVSTERHKLMNALGIFPTVSFSFLSLKNTYQSIFLCSDGLYNNMKDKEIADILRTNERVDQKVDTLIAVANANGGSDNMAISFWERINND